MRVSDIEAALGSGVTADLEEAFTALVLYPGYATVDGAKSVTDLANLLDRVAHALRENRRTMPDALADMIHKEVRDNLEDRTFAAGSRAVRVYAVRWREIFSTHFVLEGR